MNKEQKEHKRDKIRQCHKRHRCKKYFLVLNAGPVDVDMIMNIISC